MIKVKKLWTTTAKLPTKGHDGDLGYDLYSAESITIQPREIGIIETGIAIQLPDGYGAIIKDRSSMAVRGLTTAAGVIDNGYTGPIKVALRNENDIWEHISVGDKIAQFVLVPVTNFDVVEVTEDLVAQDTRGNGGFGSTGNN